MQPSSNTEKPQHSVPLSPETVYEGHWTDWYDFLGNSNVERLRDFLTRWKSLDKLPQKRSQDPQEADDGQWLGQMRQTKKGNARRRWSDELDKIAAEHGMAGLFDTEGKEAKVERLRSVLQRYTGRQLPCSKSKDVQERADATFIIGIRMAHNGKGGRLWFDEYNDVAEECGFPDLFDARQKRTASSIRHRLEALRKKYPQGWPKVTRKDGQEKRDADWMRKRREHPEFISFVEETGWKRQFEYTPVGRKERIKREPIDYKKEAEDRVIIICQFIKEHGRKPRSDSNDPAERKIARSWYTLRQSKKGVGRGKWYPSVLSICSKHGVSDLFDVEDMESNSNEMTKKTVTFIQQNGRLPSASARDLNERRMGQWLGAKRQAKAGRSGQTYYESDGQIANAHGYPKLFTLGFKVKS